MNVLKPILSIIILLSTLSGYSQPLRSQHLDLAIDANVNFDFNLSTYHINEIGKPISNSDTIYVLSQMHLAHVQLWKKDFDQFEHIKSHLYKYTSDNNLPQLEMRVQLLDALYFAHKKSFKKGYESILSTIDIYEKTYNNSLPDWILVEPYLAFLLHFNQKFEQAENLYHHILFKIKKTYPTGSTTENAIWLLLATFYHYQNDSELGFTILEEMKRDCLGNTICKKTMGSYICRFQSEFAKDIGDYHQSKLYAKEALELAQNKFQSGMVWGKLAVSNAYLGNIDEADIYFNKGLGVVAEKGDTKEIVNYIENYARALSTFDQHEQIVDLYSLAENYISSTDERTSYGGNTYIIDYLHNYYRKNQEFDQSLENWKLFVCRTFKVCNIKNWDNPKVSDFQLHNASIKTFFDKSKLSFEAFLARPSNKMLLRNSIEAGLKADSIAQKLIAKIYDNSQQERILSLNASNYTHLIHRVWQLYDLDRDENTFNQLVYLISVADDVNFRLNRNSHKIKVKAQNIRSIIEQKDSLLAIINNQSTLSDTSGQNVFSKLLELQLKEKRTDHQKDEYSISDIESILKIKEDEAILIYYSIQNTLYALCINHDGRKAIKLELDNSLDTLVLKYRNLLVESVNRKEIKDAYLKANELLSQIIYFPFKHLLQHKKLTIVANGSLGLLPFDVLIPNDGSGNTICSQSYLPLLRSKDTPAPEKLSLSVFIPAFPINENTFEDKVFRSGYLGHLPYADLEKSSIKKAFPKSNILSSVSANKKELRRAFKNNSIVHLITHTKQNNTDVSNSFIALNDQDGNIDRLSYSECSRLECNAEMVVLSSCETGIGPYSRGTGIKSFSRSILSQGAKSVVCTLWPVNDRSTSMIMQEFYKNLSTGLTKDIALTKAKEKYLSNVEEKYKHPYYWAGIQLVGSTLEIKQFNNLSNIITLFAFGVIGLLLYFYFSSSFRKVKALS